MAQSDALKAAQERYAIKRPKLQLRVSPELIRRWNDYKGDRTACEAFDELMKFWESNRKD